MEAIIDKKTKKIIEATVSETILKINNISTIERLKEIKDEAFKNTEKLLYNYAVLKEHVSDEEGYFNMMYKNSSKSIVRYSASKGTFSEDQMIRSREESLLRSKSDLTRLEKAINKVKSRKEFKVIELRYLSKNDAGEVRSFEEIGEQLEKDERTIRRWKNKIIKEMSIHIFGSDAI